MDQRQIQDQMLGHPIHQPTCTLAGTNFHPSTVILSQLELQDIDNSIRLETLDDCK